MQKRKKKLIKTDLRGKEVFHICSPVSFSGKSGCDSGRREGSSTASLHRSCQKKCISEWNRTSKLNSMSPSQALPVPDSAWQVTPQLEQGSSPDMSNSRGSLFLPTSSAEDLARPGPAFWQNADLQDEAPRGEGDRWKGSGHSWPVAKGTRTPPSP